MPNLAVLRISGPPTLHRSSSRSIRRTSLRRWSTPVPTQPPRTWSTLPRYGLASVPTGPRGFAGQTQGRSTRTLASRGRNPSLLHRTQAATQRLIGAFETLELCLLCTHESVECLDGRQGNAVPVDRAVAAAIIAQPKDGVDTPWRPYRGRIQFNHSSPAPNSPGGDRAESSAATSIGKRMAMRQGNASTWCSRQLSPAT